MYKKSPLEKYITNENDLNEILCLAADKCNELSVDRQKEAAWLYERAGQYENALIQIVKLYSRVVSFSKDNSEKCFFFFSFLLFFFFFSFFLKFPQLFYTHTFFYK